jgi:hypothetical protein
MHSCYIPSSEQSKGASQDLGGIKARPDGRMVVTFLCVCVCMAAVTVCVWKISDETTSDASNQADVLSG